MHTIQPTTYIQRACLSHSVVDSAISSYTALCIYYHLMTNAYILQKLK